MKHFKGIKRHSYKKVMRLTAQLYTNACSMCNKQKEFEATIKLESCDLVNDYETWWNRSHDWSVAVNSYGLFRMDRQGKKGGVVALYIKRWIECKEFFLKNSHKKF